MQTKNIPLILIALFTLLTWSCEKETDYNPDFPADEFIQEGLYLGEYWPTETWRTCHPEEVGMNEDKLRKMNEEFAYLLELHAGMHSVIVIRNGYIVAEQYYSDDYSKDSLHRIYSCTKSITSAALGIALDEGYLSSVDQEIMDFFPEITPANPDPVKDELTIHDFLTMSAGLDWKEIDFLYEDDRNTFNDWRSSGGGVKFVLDRPLIYPPGTQYDYNTGISHVLSAIVTRSTGVSTDLYVEDKIFDPLGIEEYYWPRDGEDIPYGGTGVMLTPRDLARIGYLYLKNGMWENEQIVPASWVTASSQPYIQRRYITDYYYGYHWWVDPDGLYAAVGYAGQWLFIIPEHDLVVVFNNYLDESEWLHLSTPERMMEEYILPAIKTN